MVDGTLYCLNLNLYMHFRVGSRRPATFNMRLYVTAVNNSFQSLPVFCHKGLHLRCCIGLELNIVIWFTKIIKGTGGWGVEGGTPMIKCNLGKIRKTNSPRCPKNTFPEVFHIKFFACNIKWNISLELIANHWQRL